MSEPRSHTKTLGEGTPRVLASLGVVCDDQGETRRRGGEEGGSHMDSAHRRVAAVDCCRPGWCCHQPGGDSCAYAEASTHETRVRPQ